MLQLPSKSSEDLWVRIGMKLSDLSATRTHEQVIREWCRFLGIRPGDPAGSHAFLNATDVHAAAYHQWLKGQDGMVTRAGKEAKLAPNTIATKLSILKGIYTDLLMAGRVRMNPFYRVKIPAKDCKQKLPTEIVPFNLVAKMIDYPDQTTFDGRLWRALLCCLFGSGVRLEEARLLRVSDFRKTEKGNFYLHLRDTKSQESQDQPLLKWAGPEIESIVRERKLQSNDPEDWIFIGRHGRTAWKQPISPKQISRRFSEIGEACGCPNRVSPHSARKTYANALNEQGLSQNEIQILLRHKHGATTQRYLELSKAIDEAPGQDMKYD